ncbi:MAG: TRAP transporter substrate-binding protein DctP [Pseudomonadales bacterium]
MQRLSQYFIYALGLWFLCSQSIADNPANGEVATARIVAITIPNTPWYNDWQTLGERLAQQAGQPVKPVFYILGQLGSEESALSQLRRGRVQLGGFSLQGASSVVPELGLLLAPYLFDSRPQVDHVLDQYLSTLIEEKFKQQGLVFLRWAEVGWTNFYTREPIRSPADLQYKKLRSSNALASQLLIQAIEGNMVPLPFPDILPSLQTGLIDGGESGAIIYGLSAIPHEAPYLTLTRHAFDTGVMLANKTWFDNLSHIQRSALLDSLATTAEMRAGLRTAEQQVIADATKLGVTVYQPTEDELLQWREKTAKNHQLLIDSIGGDASQVYQIINEGKKNYNALTHGAD